MSFSRAVGQLLQASRGVPAQLRKAVGNLYTRPHGSFDSAFGCCVDFGSLRGSAQRSYAHPYPCMFTGSHLHAQDASHILYFSAKGTQTTPGGRGTAVLGWLPSSRYTYDGTSRSQVRSHVKALWPPAMLHAAGSDSAHYSTLPPSRHTRTHGSYRSHKHRPPARAPTRQNLIAKVSATRLASR